MRHIRVLVTVAVGTFATVAHAAGFGIIEQSASGMGAAFAGSAAQVNDASVQYFNPAGLAELKQPLEPGRVEQEVVLQLQRIDVDEELDRLTAHVAEARHTLGLKEAVGRRLDFLMQEFNREANTLGSKAADPRTTKAAVELKVLIEQMREQVQNLE